MAALDPFQGEFAAVSRVWPEMGLALGMYNKLSGVVVWGHNPSVSASLNLLWPNGAAYAYLGTASILEISSSSVNDTAAGTGARTVGVRGLDANGDALSETVVLNGQTPVNTVGSYLRVFGLTVLTAGSGGLNAGVLYAGTGAVVVGVPATVYMQAEIGLNASLAALYTIPSGYTGYAVEAQLGSAIAKEIDAVLFARPSGGVFSAAGYLSLIDGTASFDPHVPLALPALTDVEVRVAAGAGGGDVSAMFAIVLQKL